jgi:hypothetical protein
VFDAPYNAHLDRPRATTWAEVEHLVTTFVADSGVALQSMLPGLDDGIDRLRSRLR